MDGEVCVWDVASSTQLLVLPRHPRPVLSLAVLPTGQLATGCGDGGVRVWRLPASLSASVAAPTGAAAAAADADELDREAAQVVELRGDTNGGGGAITALALLADGRLVTGSKGAIVRVWDVDTGTCVMSDTGRTKGITALATSPALTILSGSANKTVRLWTAPPAALLPSLTAAPANARRGCARGRAVAASEGAAPPAAATLLHTHDALATANIHKDAPTSCAAGGAAGGALLFDGEDFYDYGDDGGREPWSILPYPDATAHTTAATNVTAPGLQEDGSLPYFLIT